MKSRLPVVGCCLLTTLLVGFWLGQTMPLNHEVEKEIVERSTVSPFNSDGWQLASGQEFGPAATLPTESPFERRAYADHPTSNSFGSEPASFPEENIGPDVAYFPEVIKETAGVSGSQSTTNVEDAHAEASTPQTGTLSKEDAAVWNAELKDLPPDQAEEILALRQQLGSVASESLGLSFPKMPTVENTEPPGMFPELAEGEARPIPIAETFPDDPNVVHASAAKESPLAKKLREEAERNYAQNIANIRTPGYKRRQIVLLNVPVAPTRTEAEQADFSVIDASSEIASPVDGSQNLWVSRLDLRQGKLTSTSNPFDLAIDGPGWLQIDRNGRPEYVRGGVLALNQHQELNIRTSAGLLPIQPAISLPEDTRRIIITSTGEVIAVDLKGLQKAVGQLTSFEFLNASALKRTAVGTYAETKEAGNAIASNSSVQFLQSFLEEANVDPHRELAEFDHLQTVAENLVATENHETSP